MKGKPLSILVFLLIVFLSTVAVPQLINNVHAKVTVTESNAGKITAGGEVAVRYSNWNWFQPAGGTFDNSYDYFFSRSRLNLELESGSFRAFLQAQDVHMAGLPENSAAPAPQGPLGIGAIYNLHTRDDNPHSLIIRQAYIDLPKLFSENLSLRLGRFDYVDGKEVMYKNPKVNQIKNIRLAERLIGPFGWSSFGRSFDGFQVVYDRDNYNIHSTATHPTQGGFENNAHRSIPGIDLYTLTGTFKYNKILPDAELRLFYFFYEDDRNISATPGQSGLNQGDIQINTFGSHLLKLLKTNSGEFDFVYWGAIQDGEWGAVDHSAWALDFELGYHFLNLPWKPWLRTGYYASSGDSSSTDGEHETFYQLLPTARKYALFPFYNMMNNEDFFFQGIIKPTKDLLIRADLHILSLSEKNDLWYMGAGPTVEQGGIFGYIGRPSNGMDDLATVFDLVVNYTFSKNISGTAYWGHAFGGDVIESIYPGDEDSDFFYVEMKFSF